MQDRVSERLQNQIIEETKELESTKTEEALQIAEKAHDLWMYQNEKEEAKRVQGWAPPRKHKDKIAEKMMEQHDIMEEFKKKFDGAPQWTINDWISILTKGGGPKRRFQYCLNPTASKHFLYFRAIQGHTGGNLVDPDCKTMYYCQRTSL